MHPYSTIRLQASADCADGKAEGRKSSAVNVKGKNGDIHNSSRSSASKRATRRMLKRMNKAREDREWKRAYQESCQN